MIQHIECLQPEGRIQPFIDGKGARDLRVKLIRGRTAEGVPADVSIQSRMRHTSVE